METEKNIIHIQSRQEKYARHEWSYRDGKHIEKHSDATSNLSDM